MIMTRGFYNGSGATGSFREFGTYWKTAYAAETLDTFCIVRDTLVEDYGVPYRTKSTIQ